MKNVFIGLTLVLSFLVGGAVAQQKLYTIEFISTELADEDFHKIVVGCAKEGAYGGIVYKLTLSDGEPTGYVASSLGNACFKEVREKK